MPFIVTLSDQVVIDPSQAGPDDFLCLRLQDGTSIYVRLHQREGWLPVYMFDEQFLPPGFIEASHRAAAELLRRSQGSMEELRQLFELRSDKSVRLQEFIARQLRSNVSVVGLVDCNTSQTGSLNVGLIPTVWFPRSVGSVTSSLDSSVKWTASAPIAQILPLGRFEIEVTLAKQPG